jgi:hypothetical protein
VLKKTRRPEATTTTAAVPTLKANATQRSTTQHNAAFKRGIVPFSAQHHNFFDAAYYAAPCSTTQHNAARCNIAGAASKRSGMHRGAAQCSTMQDTVFLCSIQCNTVQHNAAFTQLRDAASTNRDVASDAAQCSTDAPPTQHRRSIVFYQRSIVKQSNAA